EEDNGRARSALWRDLALPHASGNHGLSIAPQKRCIGLDTIRRMIMFGKPNLVIQTLALTERRPSHVASRRQRSDPARAGGNARLLEAWPSDGSGSARSIGSRGD